MLGFMDVDRIATPQEAVSEWAWNVGREPGFSDRMWLLHDYDVWVRNPHYHGPRQPHPEEVNNLSPEEIQASYYTFSDGTPTSIYDDYNWPAAQRALAKQAASRERGWESRW